MWLLFGVIAIIVTFVNLYLYIKGKNYHLAMAIGLSFTSLTLVASYNMVSDWINNQDWVALLDVVPTMSRAFWILTIISILLNIMPIFLTLNKKIKWAQLVLMLTLQEKVEIKCRVLFFYITLTSSKVCYIDSKIRNFNRRINHEVC